MGNRVLVDTSAWIEFFRQKTPYYNSVSSLILSNALVTLPIIIAELVQGAKTAQEGRQLKELLRPLPKLAEYDSAWEEAGELAFQLKRAGLHPGLADCFIATLCIHHSVPILTLDKHFKMIKAKTSLKFHQSS